jgi:hypothetical protein
MHWGRVFKWTYDTAIADTGAGGLFGTPALITGWYLDAEPINPAFPYAVLSLVSETESDVLSATPEAVEVQFQVGVYSDADAGQAVHDAITARIRTLFRRAQPTISGYTVSQVLLDGSPFQTVTDRARYSVHQFRVFLSK